MPLFETLLPMSFTGGVMIMVVFAARPLLKRLRTYNVLLLLWMCALFLLVAPFRPASPSSVYNAVGESPALSQAFTVGMAGTAPQFYAGGQGSLSVAPSRYLNIIPTIWLVGFFIILAYLCVSMAALKRLFKDAIPRTDLSARVPVYVSSRAAGPITYGIIRPRVVLPINIDETDAATLGHVLSHEYQHVRYKDALINIAWLVALCAHWFNPLAWAGWFFLRRDMETRCDAGAIKRLGANYIKSYANALLEMAPVRKAHALPLAFGSTSLNERIERVVAYRPAKRSAVIVATAMMLSFVSLFAVNPVRAAIAEQIVEPIMGQVVDIMELNGKITQPAAGEIRYSLFKLDIREFSQNQNSVFHTIVKSFESYEDAVSYIGEANPSADIGQIAKYSRSNNVLMRYRGTLNAIYESSFDFSFVGIAFGVETENNRDVFLLLDRASFTNRYDKRTPAVAIGLIQIVAFDNGPPQIIWL